MGYYKVLNQIEGNLYAGTHAGNYLEKAISNAKKSIWIICPYIGESYLKTLIQKKGEGVEVHALFHEVKNLRSQPTLSLQRKRTYNYSAARAPYGGQEVRDPFGLKNVVPSLLEVQRLILPQNMKERTKIKRMVTICQIIVCLIIITLFLSGAWAILSPDNFAQMLSRLDIIEEAFTPIILQMAFIVFGTIVVLLLIANDFRKKIMRIPTRQLLFSWKTDMRLVKKEQEDFLHLKMYIIDDEIAFVGSLNLTYSGINRNLESCLSIRDKGAIQQLLKIYKEVSTKAQCYSVQEIGEFYFGGYEYTEDVVIN